MSEYAKRDLRKLFRHYTKHIQAMTVEGLHAKSDIAEELAWRDAEIERLTAERDELRRQLAEAGESIAAQARTIADLRGALIESREMIRVDRDSLYETSVNPDGTIDCEDDRKALAEYDDVLALIGETLDAAIDAAMELTRPAEES